MKIGYAFNSKDFLINGLWKTLLALGLLVYLILYSFTNTQSPRLFLIRSSEALVNERTNQRHIAFGLMGSVKTWPHRKMYLEAWWRPNKTRGYVYLDRHPTPDLLPWPQTAPPYRVVDNISQLFLKANTKPRFELMPRMVHGILELFREEHDGLRWVVMGDDDTVFFVDNIVDVLAEYDHNKYYYLGLYSESVASNYWFSFRQAFGGGGIVLSYALAAALVKDMDGCLVRHAQDTSADFITMACIADIGVDLTPHQGFHQIDLFGDFSGYLSAHPKVPVMSFHHFDLMDPIFPSMDRMQSTRHLMQAADADQSRLLQQTICHYRPTNWSFSISFGYSAQIYETILPRSYLQIPIETFRTRVNGKNPPFYMFNTRLPTNDNCVTPHLFFLESLHKTVSGDQIITTYLRSRPRGMPACWPAGSHSAESISKIQVFSPAKKHLQSDRCECCDIVRMDNVKADVKFRDCRMGEIIA